MRLLCPLTRSTGAKRNKHCCSASVGPGVGGVGGGCVRALRERVREGGDSNAAHGRVWNEGDAVRAVEAVYGLEEEEGLPFLGECASFSDMAVMVVGRENLRVYAFHFLHALYHRPRVTARVASEAVAALEGNSCACVRELHAQHLPLKCYAVHASLQLQVRTPFAAVSRALAFSVHPTVWLFVDATGAVQHIEERPVARRGRENPLPRVRRALGSALVAITRLFV
eukprot:TRINITY_DN6161_c0_g1_i1.p2 TRINITY_DN6161_c0_g1~~TRINITY_DN6161_c0_g1_i1.p2  ORF type:complete len:226 (+),score=61.59 TRINITY_DN6161_c0_g1_i1:2-679(+)